MPSSSPDASRPRTRRAAPAVRLAPEAALVRALRWMLARRPGRRLVLIDGPSGAGKSTFAAALAAAVPGRAPTVVALDAVYPGWGGLRAVGPIVSRSLRGPHAAARPARVPSWDWVADRAAAEATVVRPGPLVIEGCGAFATGPVDDRALRIWVEAPDRLRRPRALAREAGGFDAHWSMWETQWRAYAAREHPRSLAGLLVDGR